MAPTVAPGEVAARVRRDAERNVLRLRNGLKHIAGVGQPQIMPTPKDTIWSFEKIQLWQYRSDNRTIGSPLLFVHSLVSRSYVFDLVPGNSVVQAFLDRGFDVYLVDWGVPDELEAGNTLSNYIDDYIPTLVREVSKAAGGADVTVFGYCYGGLLSLLSVAGNRDLPVQSLAVMATPVDFTPLGPLWTMIQPGRVEPADVLDNTGNVPADVMLNSIRSLAPLGDINSYVNLWQHLWDDEFVAAHQVMTQWSRDHIPFPGATFLEAAELFSRRNLLPTGEVPVAGRTIELADITVPFLSILGEKDHIIPPSSTEVLTPLVGSDDVTEMRFPSGHVGLMIGRTAQRRNIPAMADWLESRAGASS
ncbi:MAG: alpha/beta fold hydrolase [Ilumatobacteraceae bacterium]